MDGEGVELGEGPGVEEQLDPLPGGELTLGMLLVGGVSPAMHGVVLALAQQVDPAVGGIGGLGPGWRLLLASPGHPQPAPICAAPRRYSPKTSRSTPHPPPILA